MKRMAALALLIGSLVGCGQTVPFRVVDAQTGEPVPGVQVHRSRTARYGSLRLRGATSIEILGNTSVDGRAVAGEVTGDDAILFDKDGYWPAVFYSDFPIDHVDSRDRDAEARDKKTGLIGLDAVLAIKAAAHKQMGVNEGGEPAQTRKGAVIIPLHRIGVAGE